MALLDAKILQTIVTPDERGSIVQLQISDAPHRIDGESPLPASSAISLVLAVRVEGDGRASLAQLQRMAIDSADSILQQFLRDLK
jgi:hypothetical protein